MFGVIRAYSNRPPCSILRYLRSTTAGDRATDVVLIIKFVPQDTAKLIELQGGTEKFISRLDYIFEQVSNLRSGSRWENDD